VVLIGIERGLIDLEEPAGPPGSTVRHLLAHASGLPFEGATPIAAPGRRRIYSNTAFDHLGRMVSVRAGRPFSEVLAEQILGPLGLDAQLEGRPSEGLVGTTTGLARFARELLTPTLMGRQTLASAATVAFPGLPGTLPGVGRFKSLDWGLGFEIRADKAPHWTGTRNSPGTFGHFGGAGTFLWVDPAAQVGLVATTGREYGPWALEVWPDLSDAVLMEASGT
jgi:CubicO group peptidase (beta-lactamase class C family)